MNQNVELALRLVIAVLAGGLIGFEREWAGKAAGVRTHGLVALGSALLGAISIYGFGGQGDPARVAAQVVVGIGFMGAGLILHRRGGVKGLTTAAALWVTAAIGLGIGIGMIVVSLAATVLATVLLRLGPRFGHPSERADQEHAGSPDRSEDG
jgi:putative Mg2+ transporter-C (MgtC) family protein